MKRLLLLFLCLFFVVPAMAFSQSYTAPQDQALYVVNIYSNGGTGGTITIHQQNGDTKTGTWSYSDVIWALPPYQTATISVGANSSSTTYITQSQLITGFYASSRSLDVTESSVVGTMGQTKFIANEIVTTPAKPYPITSFEITATDDVTVDVKWVAIGDASKDMESLDQKVVGIMDIANQMFWDAIDFLTNLVYWLRYFFVDNISMIVALFLAVPMAFAAKNSKGNPERFLRQYFKTLKGFFEFVLSIWRMLIESIGTIRGWFRV